MRFLSDQMLARGGKWLRVLGFDVVFPSLKMTDLDLKNLAKSTSRLLLTRDQLLFENTYPSAYWVRSVDWKEQVLEIIKAYGLFEKIQPFSRCLKCGFLLQKTNIPPVEVLHLKQVPKSESFSFCAYCQQYYWWGSHPKKMKAMVFKWLKQNPTWYTEADL